MGTREEYDAFLAALRKETGIEAFVADESGLVSIRVDDTYNVNLQFVEATGKILCFVEIATLPKDASAAVFRNLLAGGLFGKETAGGYFALEAKSDTVVYNYFFDFEKAASDVDDFVATIEKILQLCEIWSERIRRDLAGEGVEGASYENAEHNLHLPGMMIRA